jgi:hypothetical protein
MKLVSSFMSGNIPNTQGAMRSNDGTYGSSNSTDDGNC